MTEDLLIRPLAEGDWDAVVAMESSAYSGLGLSEERTALRSRADASPTTCFVAEIAEQPAGYLLSLPYPAGRYPDLGQVEGGGFHSRNLHLHDIVIASTHRRQGLAHRLLAHLERTARAQGYERISLVAVGGSERFWSARGFTHHADAAAVDAYHEGARYMSRSLTDEAPPSRPPATPAPAGPPLPPEVS
ncbi:GNAT family N-acetyltransferase [Streptomyces sp. NPDC047097]|uniref:GNAT family N-acetyltransferase n=1 Tax=Streptomyces sp. NPDC047097 TaxID=3155260 RepID=UPI0033D70727